MSLQESFPTAAAGFPVRDAPGSEGQADAASLGRLGSLEVRLARSAAEIRQAQELRFEVFYRELSAVAGVSARMLRRDADAFDEVCDHMLVLDHAAPGHRPFGLPPIVGTYRLLLQDAAERHGGFYSASEFEIAPLLARWPQLRFLELGRSCVLDGYRTRRTVELLWHGVWAYARARQADVMFGCASLPGSDPAALAEPLSFLHHHARAPAAWAVAARPERRVAMDRIAACEIDAGRALRALPPLIRGYLRLGAFVGDGAVVDRQFGTTDVCTVLPVSRIEERYLRHFGPEAGRFVA